MNSSFHAKASNEHRAIHRKLQPACSKFNERNEERMIYRQPVTRALYRSNFQSSFLLTRRRFHAVERESRRCRFVIILFYDLRNGLSTATLISQSAATYHRRATASEKDPGQAFMREIFASPRKRRKNATRGNGGRKRIGWFKR